MFAKGESKPSPVSDEISAFLGKKTVFEGKMTFQGVFRLDGQFEGEIFDSGIEAFNPVADQLNRVSGGVEWRSLGYILSHLWLEKYEDDGSQSVQFYTNELVFTNESGVKNSFHFSKEETLNVPIQQVTVNGYPFPYRIEAGALRLDLMLAAEEQITIRIQYGD